MRGTRWDPGARFLRQHLDLVHVRKIVVHCRRYEGETSHRTVTEQVKIDLARTCCPPGFATGQERSWRLIGRVEVQSECRRLQTINLSVVSHPAFTSPSLSKGVRCPTVGIEVVREPATNADWPLVESEQGGVEQRELTAGAVDPVYRLTEDSEWLGPQLDHSV